MKFVVQWDLLPHEVDILVASVRELPASRADNFIDFEYFNYVYFAYSEWDKDPTLIVDESSVDLEWVVDLKTDHIFNTEKEALDYFYEQVNLDKEDLFELIFTFQKRKR